MYVQGETRDYKVQARPGVVVTFRTPTEGERRRLTPTRPDDDDPGAFFSWCEKVVRAQVTGVATYSYRGKAIVTAEDLVNYGETAVLGEVAAEIFAETSLTEEERKNSAAPSATSP